MEIRLPSRPSYGSSPPERTTASRILNIFSVDHAERSHLDNRLRLSLQSLSGFPAPQNDLWICGESANHRGFKKPSAISLAIVCRVPQRIAAVPLAARQRGDSPRHPAVGENTVATPFGAVFLKMQQGECQLG